MTVGHLYRSLRSRLTSILGSAGEGESAARILLEDLAGYDRNYLFIHSDREVLPFLAQRLEAAVDEIAAGAPVQYAAGAARFMGMNLKVNPSVLIPRPETEGLVDMVTDYARTLGRDLSILDIGTGSGAIAIALARAIPFAKVQGIDISPGALETAAENARRLSAEVSFVKMDILAPPPVHTTYDIIVSNPPYIALEEKAAMDPRVYGHEPSLALFVPDDDPLKFYRAIAIFSRLHLRRGGRLFLEINSRFPREMRQLLESAGFLNIDILRDYKGNYRFATASNP